MMILRTKVTATSLVALVLLFVSSCSQPSGPVASGSKSFGATPPPHSSSNFNLATPSLSVVQISEGTLSLSWPNGGDEASILPGGQYYPINWTGANVANGVKPGSEHTEIYWWGDGAWVLYGEHVGQDLVITGLPEGEYSFYVKEKSKENSTGKKTETFHSLPSNVVTITVETEGCIDDNTFVMELLEQLNQNENDKVKLDPENNMNIIASSPSGKFNLHVRLSATCENYQFDQSNTIVTFHVDGTTGDGSTVTATYVPESDKWIANNVMCSDEMDVAKDLIIMVGATPLTGWTVTCTED